MSESVAIIMRSKDEMPYIRVTLDALHRQHYRPFELYAVDSGSTDGSLEALRSYCAEDRLFRIDPADYVPGKVLNDTIGRTTQDLIVLLNGDAIPRSDDWLGSLLQPILRNEADATFSRQVARPNARFIVDFDYQRAYAPGNGNGHFFSAAACAFKRTLWEQHNFHNDGYAEDAIWATACRLLNTRFSLVPESEVEHSHNYTLSELYQKRFRHGQSFARVLGEPAAPGRRLFGCARELVRDFIYACRMGQPLTIPYNIAYRTTIYAGHYMGVREGSL